jgi:hypothetical protein
MPVLRDADVLQHYAGATDFGGVQHKNVDLPENPQPVTLNFNLYQRQLAADQTFFNFGIRNTHPNETLRSPRMRVQFPVVPGLTVNATANPGDEPWTAIWTNQVYTFAFPTINAGEAYSGTGVLRVTFPSPGQYPIKLTITGEGLRPIRRTLLVMLT